MRSRKKKKKKKKDAGPISFHSLNKNDEMNKNVIEMKAIYKIKIEFDSVQLDIFWCEQRNTFPQLAKTVLKVLVAFVTTYFCETDFSTLIHIKTKPKIIWMQVMTCMGIS